jgi:hypothetical protein
MYISTDKNANKMRLIVKGKEQSKEKFDKDFKQPHAAIATSEYEVDGFIINKLDHDERKFLSRNYFLEFVISNIKIIKTDVVYDDMRLVDLEKDEDNIYLFEFYANYYLFTEDYIEFIKKRLYALSELYGVKLILELYSPDDMYLKFDFQQFLISLTVINRGKDPELFEETVSEAGLDVYDFKCPSCGMNITENEASLDSCPLCGTMY